MTWEHPAALWFLILPIAGLVWTLVRPERENDANAWPKITRLKSTMGGLKPNASQTPARTRPILMTLAIVLAIMALARPQWGQTEEQVFERAREVLIALDLSRSMLVDDVNPSRLDRSKLMIQSLLDYLEGERVGLIVFAGTAFLQSPLSADYQVLRGFLPELDPDYLPQGGTDYEAMLETALNSFGQEASLADRFLIVLSDGESLDGDWKPKANDLRDRSIQVLGLGVGTSQGGLVPDSRGGFMKDGQGAVVLSRLNDATLRELSDITRGVYQNAAGWIDLGDLIDKTIEKGRAGQFLEDRTVTRIERFQHFLLAAVIFAFLSLWWELPSLPRTRRIQKSIVKKERKRFSRPRKNEIALSLTRVTTTSALPFALLLLTMTSRATAQPLVDSAPPNPEPLKEIVTGIMEQPNVGPADWAGLARETVKYGQALRESGQPIVQGTIADGLDAVDRGETVDPHAADWASLREQLVKLLEEPPQQDQQQEQDQQDDQENQENESQDQPQQSNQQNQDQNDQQQNQQNEDQNQSEQQPANEQGDQQEEKNEQSEQQQNEPQNEEQEQAAQGQDEDADQEPQENREMQKIGSDTSSVEDLPEDQELAAAMQELEQVRNQDSPARLFQILEGEPRPDKDTGKNW